MKRDTSTRVLAEGVVASNDTWATGVNNNTLVIGSSGSGKSRGYCIPNIERAEGSVVVADTKGDLCERLRPILQARGFTVQCIDFTDCARTPLGYNPLDFVRMEDDLPDEQDMLSIAAAICPIETDEPFWDYAARDLISSLIGYALTCLPEEECNLATVNRLLEIVADDRFGRLVGELAIADPRAFAVRQYGPTRASRKADKMIGSIRGIAGEKLSPFRFGGVERMFTMAPRADFTGIRYEKTALFIHVSDVDRSMDRLVALFYQQLFKALVNAKEAEGRPFYPVHVVMDDFACGCRVADFDRTISVIRSRGIYASVIIQSIAQLEALYGRAAATIAENCDTVLYLGGNDPGTARWIGDRANRPAHSVLSMPPQEGLLLQRGKPARRVRRYGLEADLRALEFDGKGEICV